MVMMMMVQYHHHHMILILILIIILHCEFNCEMLTTCVRHLVQYRLRHPFSIWPLACPSHILIIMTTKSLMLLVNNNIVYIVTELLCSVDLFSVQCIHSRHNFSGLSDDDHDILIPIIIWWLTSSLMFHFLFSFCLLLQVDLVAIISSFVILIAGAPSLPNNLPLVLTALLRVLQICRMFRQETLQIPTHWRKVKMLQDRQTWGDMADGCPSGSLPLEGFFYSKL